MEADEPLRYGFLMQGRSIDQLNEVIADLKREMGDRAAATMAQVLREKHGITLASIGRTRLALLALGALLLMGVTWEIRSAMPMSTAVGAIPPALATALAATDLKAAWERRLPQPAVNGRSWSLVPLFDEAGAPRPRQ
ncbi:hypothetical protein [Muricoccus nepalensis]|nr:hypothetical protein [Roseomonas nepalensis]